MGDKGGGRDRECAKKGEREYVHMTVVNVNGLNVGGAHLLMMTSLSFAILYTGCL